MGAVFGSLAGAMLAFLAQFLLRGWQYKHEHWIGRAQAFVDLAAETAEVGSSYWCRAHDQAQAAETSEREAELIGKLARLDRLLPAISPHLEPDEKENIQQAMNAFLDAVSGGDFGTPANISSKLGGERARLIHVSVAELVGTVHDAIDTALAHNFWGRAFWK